MLACAFLGGVLLVYHNPSRRDTFGEDPARPVRYLVDGELEVEGAWLEGEPAHLARNRECRRLDVYLG
jgi:hypothetical protein